MSKECPKMPITNWLIKKKLDKRRVKHNEVSFEINFEVTFEGPPITQKIFHEHFQVCIHLSECLGTL